MPEIACKASDSFCVVLEVDSADLEKGGQGGMWEHLKPSFNTWFLTTCGANLKKQENTKAKQD